MMDKPTSTSSAAQAATEPHPPCTGGSSAPAPAEPTSPALVESYDIERLRDFLENGCDAKHEHRYHALQHLDALAAENSAMKKMCDSYADENQRLFDRASQAQSEVARLTERVKELERDAERYRWLAADGDRARKLLNDYSGYEVEAEIDASIDARGGA